MGRLRIQGGDHFILSVAALDQGMGHMDGAIGEDAQDIRSFRAGELPADGGKTVLTEAGARLGGEEELLAQTVQGEVDDAFVRGIDTEKIGEPIGVGIPGQRDAGRGPEARGPHKRRG